jgi:hypothetical protein
MTKLSRRDFIAGSTMLAIGASGVTTAAVPGEHCTLIMMYDPIEEQKAAFDSWWPGHLKAVGSIRGIIAAEAYQRSDVQVRAGAALALPRFATILTIQAADASAVAKDLSRGISNGKIAAGPVDHSFSKSFAYKRAKDWTSKSVSAAANHYLQMVFADPVPGREGEFANWYDETHSRELLAVPGITIIERSTKFDACPAECSASPKSLSALHIAAASIEDFKVGLEKVAKTFTDTTSYDLANAWRLTLQKI